MKRHFYLHLLLMTSLSVFSCQPNSDKTTPVASGDKKGPIEPTSTEQPLAKRKHPVTEPVFMDFRLGMAGNEFNRLLEQHANLNQITKKNVNGHVLFSYPFTVDDVIIPMNIGYLCENKSDKDCMNSYIEFISLSTHDELFSTRAYFEKIKKMLQRKYGNYCYINLWEGKEVSDFYRKDIEWKTTEKHIVSTSIGSIDDNDKKSNFIEIRFERIRDCSQKGDMTEFLANRLLESSEADYLKKKFGKPTASDKERTKSDF